MSSIYNFFSLKVLWVEQQHVRYHERREIKDDTIVSPDETGDDYRLRFNDPLYPKQWYLVGT